MEITREELRIWMFIFDIISVLFSKCNVRSAEYGELSYVGLVKSA